MFKDIAVSFYENIKTKSTNPFWGTLAIVWLVYNWNLIYGIFNFDSEYKLANKIEYIITHFTANPFLPNLSWCILKTFAIIIVSYFLVNLSRLIINLYDKKVTPLVYKLTDKSSVVLVHVYNESEKQCKILESKFEEEKTQKSKYKNLSEQAEETISNLKNVIEQGHSLIRKELLDEKFEKNSINIENTALKDRIRLFEIQIRRLVEFKDLLLSQDKTYTELVNQHEKEIFYLENEPRIMQDFRDMVINVRDGVAMSNSNIRLAKLIEMGFIEKDSKFNENLNFYKLTVVGEIIKNRIMTENYKNLFIK